MERRLCFLFKVFVRCVLIVGFVNLTPVKALAETYKIMAFGDSLSAGYNLPAPDSFPSQLEKVLLDNGFDVSVINAGVSGDTTRGGLERVAWALMDEPDLVILELGANDALRGLDPSQAEKNLAEIIQKMQASNVDVLLAGMYAPPNYGAAYQEEFNAIYPRLSERFEVDLFPFFLEGVAGIPDLNLDDGIHPNAQGIGIIVENIIPYVEGFIKN